MEINLSVCTFRDLGGSSVNLVSWEGVLLMKGLGQTDGMFPGRVYASRVQA